MSSYKKNDFQALAMALGPGKLPNLSLFSAFISPDPLHVVVFSPTDTATFTLGTSIQSCRHTNALTQTSVFIDTPPPKHHTFYSSLSLAV